MSIDNRVEVTLPELYPDCSSCVFAQRAIDRTKEAFSNNLKAINVECNPTMSGGARQVKTGKFIEYKNRLMTITPKLLKPGVDGSSLYARGQVQICPQYPIEGTSEEFPDAPELTWTWEDRWERTLTHDNSF